MPAIRQPAATLNPVYIVLLLTLINVDVDVEGLLRPTVEQQTFELFHIKEDKPFKLSLLRVDTLLEIP